MALPRTGLSPITERLVCGVVMVRPRGQCYNSRTMDMSPLHNHDGVNAASALENLAHRLVAVHHRKTPEPTAAWREDDVVPDLPLFSESEFGLDLPPPPAQPLSFLDRIRQWFSA